MVNALTSSAGSPVRKQKPKPKRAPETDLPPSDENKISVATTAEEQLERLSRAGFTAAEVAMSTGASVRGIELRREKAARDAPSAGKRTSSLDGQIDALFSIFYLLNEYGVPGTNIRAWLMGRSRYLEEQRPARLLSTGDEELYELVRQAANAYAKGETPQEFLANREPLPRPEVVSR